ncbi:hypothetical protein [Bifidobacterium miconisargentati]|uniref:hypothetical protein n=1 Tax=Bifidobacterium miconisargentati TaxID=2834437 RepID=UPI001BDCA32B|nr:hypothetical protein [Bifidobacterium miconisargentati]MBW3089585.1 hypothetical protein [Bifidobacterium miconisargentati]
MITNTWPMEAAAALAGEREPITLHWVRFGQSHEAGAFALCGEYLSTPRRENPGQSTSGLDAIMCPMCELEHDAMLADPKGWANRRMYGDSGDPNREAVRSVLITHIMTSDTTITETARTAGLDPRELYRHIMAGDVSLGELDAIGHATGDSPLSLLKGITAIRVKREQARR